MRIDLRLSVVCLLAAGCSQRAGNSPTPMPNSGGARGSSATSGSGGSVKQDTGGGGAQATTPGSGDALAAGSGGANAVGGGGNGGNADGTGGNAGGAGGNAGGTGGNAGAGGDAAGSGGTVTVAQNFSCTLIIGCYQTSQWFDGGFESAVGNAKWEIKWDHYTFTENWANPTDNFWNVPITSQCTSNATTPDRVLFIAYSMTLSTESEWEAQFSKVVDNIKTKFASVKQIELLGMVRAPNDQPCPGNSDVSIIVGPGEDQAMQAIADKSAGMVKVGPKYFAPSCSSFTTNNTNLTGAAAAAVAQSLIPAFQQ